MHEYQEQILFVFIQVMQSPLANTAEKVWIFGKMLNSA